MGGAKGATKYQGGVLKGHLEKKRIDAFEVEVLVGGERKGFVRGP